MMLKELSLWSVKLKQGVQLAETFYRDKGSKLPLPITKIAFAGMGGSGIAGRIFKTFLDRRPGVVTTIIESTSVPAHVDAKTFAIVASYSGQTWETIDVLEELSQKVIPTLVLAHGGKAIEIAQRKNILHVILPESLTPRSALGVFLGFLGTLFDLVGLLPGGAKMVDIWIKDAEEYVPVFAKSSYFTQFLEEVKGFEVMHIWGIPGDSAAAAYRATTQFNENSKVIAVYNNFPELAHNLLVGFTNPTNSMFVLFMSTLFLSSHMAIAIESITEILKEKGVVLCKPPTLGDTFESQIFIMILWADFASYHFGKIRGVDVEHVQIIEDLKRGQKTKQII